jgi:hydrogenase nickel incorporation protein HypA/HybF
MHELSLAQNVVELLAEEGRRHGLRRIERLRLKIGALRGVVPEALRSCMTFVCEGTIAEGCAVDLEIVGGQASCSRCHLEYEIVDRLFACPSCGHPGGAIIAGEELQLVEIEGD